MNEGQKEAKKFLQSYRVTMAQAQHIVDDYAAAQSVAHSITSVIGGCGGCWSPSGEKMADAAVEMVSHADSLMLRRSALTQMCAQRDEVIREVAARNQLLGEVLNLIYVDGMRPCEVQRVLERDRRHPYSQSSIYRLRDRALEKAHEVMEEKGLCA